MHIMYIVIPLNIRERLCGLSLVINLFTPILLGDYGSENVNINLDSPINFWHGFTNYNSA